ncbi:MAG: rod shape-determining protein, partial [Clostridia bacterium]
MGKLSFGLDLGQDTLKMYFAYPHDEYNFELGESEWGATCKHSVKSGIVLLDGMEAYPAVAFYDSGKDSWVFGESALNGACNSQKPIVGIKEILKNCDKPSVFSGKHFVNSSCGYEFNAKTDTQEMLVQKFLTFVLNDLKEAYMRSIGFLAQDDVSVSKEVEFTFPSTASDNYKITLKKMIEETGHTVKAVAEPTAAAICCLSEDVKLGNLTMVVDIGEDISSVGLFSPQTGLSQSSDMRKVETISIGGNDFDNELIKYIEAHCGREEELTNYQQFMLRQDAKSAKEYLCSGAALATI